MASYRTYVARSAASDRGADGISVSTIAGDVVVCLWTHPYGANVYFNWDDSTFPVNGTQSNSQYGIVKPAAGSHHIDAYCDNGGPNVLCAFILKGVRHQGIRDVKFASNNPNYSPYPTTVTPSTRPGCIVCSVGQADHWNCSSVDGYYDGGVTEVYYSGNYNGWYPSLAGYRMAPAGTSVSLTAYYTYGTGDPDYDSQYAVAVDSLAGGGGFSVIFKNWQSFLDDLRRGLIPAADLRRRYLDAVQI